MKHFTHFYTQFQHVPALLHLCVHFCIFLASPNAKPRPPSGGTVGGSWKDVQAVPAWICSEHVQSRHI